MDIFVDWCENKQQVLNVAKIKEIDVNFRRTKTRPNTVVEMVVMIYRYLRVHLNYRLE